MLLLATQAEPQMRAHRHPNLGRLLPTPATTRAPRPARVERAAGEPVGLVNCASVR